MQVVIRALALLLAAVLVVPPLTAAPAAAQDCPPFDLADADQLRAKLAGSDTVFEGRVQAVAHDQTATGENRFTHRVLVRVVYSGDPGRNQAVEVVTIGRAFDGLGRLQPGMRYLFFTNAADDDTVAADACGGTMPLRQSLEGAQVALIETLVAEAAEQRTAVAFSVPERGTEPPPSLVRLAAPGAALALLAVLGLMAVIAISTRRD